MFLKTYFVPDEDEEVVLESLFLSQRDREADREERFCVESFSRTFKKLSL